MPRLTFFWLVECLLPRLQCQGNNMRDPIAVDEHVAISIWWMVNTVSYRLISNQFRIAKSTIVGIMVKVC